MVNCRELSTVQSLQNKSYLNSVPHSGPGTNTMTKMVQRCNLKNNCNTAFYEATKEVVAPNGDLELPWRSWYELPAKNCAAPYTEKSNVNTAPDFQTNMSDSGFVSLRRYDEEEISLADDVEITTLSRRSYKLDRYRKNAMLIFINDCYEDAESDVEMIKECFENFRFEVEVHRNKTGDEMRHILLKYSMRDFTEYGAEAIVVLAPTSSIHSAEGCRPDYTTPGSNFEYEYINMHLTILSPPTLRSKPKIFITNNHSENTELYDNDFKKRMTVQLVQSRRYDMMELWLSNHPLRFLCQEMAQYGDQKSLQQLVNKVINKIENDRWVLDGGNSSCRMGSLSRAINFYRTV